MRALYKWFTHGGFNSDGSREPWRSPHATRAPIEVIVIRCFGVAWLASFLVGTVSTRPYPELRGRGAVILLAIIVLIAAAVATQPQNPAVPVWRRVTALVGVTIAAAVLAALQPHGTWQTGPVLVGLI